MPKETLPTLPEGYVPFHFEPGELPDLPESMGDRIGAFVPTVGAEVDAVDALPTDEDLHARKKHVSPTEAEKEATRRAVEEAKRQIWPAEAE